MTDAEKQIIEVLGYMREFLGNIHKDLAEQREILEEVSRVVKGV